MATPPVGRYIAGGMTLIDLMREEVEQPEQLIDIMLCHWTASVPKPTTLSLARWPAWRTSLHGSVC